jgi:arginase
MAADVNGKASGAKVRLVQVPYDSGHRGERMGRGPEYLVRNGVCRAVEADGSQAVAETIEAPNGFLTENGTAFELHRLVGDRVRAALEEGVFPLVLSGNCNTSAVGSVAGHDDAEIGVVWFDGHGEFNTPETTGNAFLDGMGLAMAVGACWKNMTRSIPGFRPVPEENVVLVGAGGADQAQKQRLSRSGVNVVWTNSIEEEGVRKALAPALRELASRVETVYVHIDPDVLSPVGSARANGYAPPFGLKIKDVEEGIGMVGENLRIGSGGVASYDPAFDGDGLFLQAIIRLTGALVAQNGKAGRP